MEDQNDAARALTGDRRDPELLRRLAQVVEETTTLVAMTDLQGKFFFVNPTFLKTLGYPKEELLGTHFSTVLAESNPPEVFRELAKYEPGGWTGEARLRRKDGTEFSASLILQPLTDRQGQGIGRAARENSPRRSQAHDRGTRRPDRRPDHILHRHCRFTGARNQRHRDPARSRRLALPRQRPRARLHRCRLTSRFAPDCAKISLA
jgi:PAS domain S-box-containing protein